MRAFRRESGYALLMMLLLLMGAGGVVLAGFTQQARQEAEQQRHEHNRRVLKEAKQALLMYAYRYPDIALAFNGTIRGPGRLPCPDTDVPGSAGSGTPNPSFNCVAGGNAMVGRFPWRAPGMEFYDARDASGEHLWYAVSADFANTGPAVVNSNTEGSITLVDHSGRILYDGAANGIAAVIIAPGSVVRRDEDAIPDGVYEYSQVRQTAAQQVDSRNYLDTFGRFDNSLFNNGESNSDDDGFILGPVFDTAAGDTVVNDQFIVVTADEIVEMAEKKVLETYRDAIRNYLAKTGGVYPWLYSYNGVDYNQASEDISVAIDKLSTFFPASATFATEKTDYLGIDPDPTKVPPRGHMGRIPSAFGSYFTEGDSQPIDTRLVNIELALIDALAPDVFGITACFGCDTESEQYTTFYREPVNGNPKLSFSIADVSTDVKFVNTGPGTGRLSVTFPSPVTIGPIDVYFYNNDHAPVFTYWTACEGTAGTIMDCSRDGAGNPTPGLTNAYRSRILHMSITIEFDGVEEFVFDYTNPLPAPVVTPASATSHATITQTYPAANIVSFPGTLTATFKYNRHFHENDTVMETGNTYSTGTIDLTGATIRSLRLGMRYYPEIPRWALDNRWHDYIRMAYAYEYEPSQPPGGACNPGSSCMELTDSAGKPQANALLVIAGKGEWQDGDPGDLSKLPNGRLKNDLWTVFDPSNENFNRTFYRRKGNDQLMAID